MTNNNTTNKFILNLGISPDLLGYGYAVEAINTIKEMRLNNEPICQFTALYEEIANKFNTTSTSVERAIRHSVGKAFASDNSELKEIFKAFVGRSGKVTNSCFICTVAEHLIMNDA